MKITAHVLTTLIFSMILLLSCTDVQFEKPQPFWVSNESVIPKNLWGTYVSGEDTLRVTKKRIVDTKKNPDFDLNLSDSVDLKTYNHNYFLNIRGEHMKNWEVIMAKVENNEIILYTLSCKDLTNLKKLKEITAVKEITNAHGEDTTYVINPTAEEFQKILEQDLFRPSSDTLRKIK